MHRRAGEVAEQALTVLSDAPTVFNLVRPPNAAQRPTGDLILCDVARALLPHDRVAERNVVGGVFAAFRSADAEISMSGSLSATEPTCSFIPNPDAFPFSSRTWPEPPECWHSRRRSRAH